MTVQNSSKRIVVLGGGIGGQVAANQLRRKLSRNHSVVLIDKNATYAFPPSFLWMMTGDRRRDDVVRPLSSLLRAGIELVIDEATHIDGAGKTIHVSDRQIPFDYLVLALGAETDPDRVPGLSKAAHSLYSLDGCERIYRDVQNFNGGTIAVVVASVPYKCPGAPHETAMLLSDVIRRRGLRDKTDIHLFTPEPQPLPVAGPEMGKNVLSLLESRNVHFHPLHKISSVRADERQLIFDGRPPASYDLLIAIPPHQAPSVVRDAGLTNESGWVPVNGKTLLTKHPGVYAIGDIAAVSIPGRWKPEVPMMLPKAGVFAHDQAEVVAERITDEINGRASVAEFCGDGYCMLEAGESMAGFAYGNFYGEPSPQLRLRNIGRAWHIGKVLFEKWWLAPIGIRKWILKNLLAIGARALRIPVRL
jgi:sulfide:quinone oxidoreductase